jgi:hypothetical protein
MGEQAVVYVEIDVDFCALNYGVAPCQAVLGVTGDDRCYNTLKTCQDRLNFSNDPVTLRFAQDAAYLPPEIEAIPSIMSVSFSPAVISLGKDLGQRATLNVTFRDHPHDDTGEGFDPYRALRDYDAFSTGSFWGKFRARQPYLKGRSLRLIRGYVGQTLAEMETRHYVIEAFNGPTPQGGYSIEAKDILKLADGDRAQAPIVSNGFLVAGISAAALSATLSPSGIGNVEYPASGHVAIGGEEIVSFTRSGDVLTIVRAQLGTTAAAHDAQDRVQLCLTYAGDDPADIISDLLTNYAGIDAAYIPLTQWQTETGTFLQRVYTATIAEATDVKKLVSELIEQAALAMWWDDEAQLIRLKVLRAISTDAQTFDETNTLAGTLRTKEQPGQRASQIWTWYGQRNPLRPIDEPDNYRSTLATVNLQAETDEGQAAITKIFARWIPAFGRDTAERLNDILLGRFQVPPRQFQFEVMRDTVDAPMLGGGYQVAGWSIQDEAGRPATAPIQVTRLNALSDRYTVEAEEMLFEQLDPADLIDRTIIIDSNVNSVNFRTLHDSIYPAPVALESPSISVTCIIETGVIVGSDNTSGPAFDVGTWPAGVNLLLQIRGRIQGAGGAGGVSDGNGGDGGTALYSRQAIVVEIDPAAEIWGGGGGGGGGEKSDQTAGGGGGAGQVPGAGGVADGPGEAGTTEAGGGGGLVETEDGNAFGGDGGDPAQAGDGGFFIAFPTVGGAAGTAIDGLSFLTIVDGPGDRRGAEIN